MTKLNREVLAALLGEDGGSNTHMHVLGSSNVGKSRFLQSLFEDALDEDCGIGVIDWAGTLYDACLGVLAYFQPKRQVILIDPSRDEWVVPYNPFRYRRGDPGTVASRFLDLTIKPFGAVNTNVTQTLERVLRIFFHYVIAANETLPNAAELLDFKNPDVVAHALRVMNTPSHRLGYRKLLDITNTKNFAQWRNEIGSTDNRLTRFVSQRAFRRFMAVPGPSLDVDEVLDANAIILINLHHTDHLYVDAARMFATFLLNDFFHAAERRNGTHKRFVMILDEFQEYLSPDLAGMLNGVRKGGLDLVMAHQHLGPLLDNPNLLRSIYTNAQIKAAFGGLDYESAEYVVRNLLLNEVNQNRVKDEFTSQKVVGHRLVATPSYSETDQNNWSVMRSKSRQVSSRSGVRQIQGMIEGSREYPDSNTVSRYVDVTQSHAAEQHQESAESATELDGLKEGGSHAVTRGIAYALLPIYQDVVSSRTNYSIEEKTSMLSEELMSQPARHMTIKIKTAPATRVRVPNVDEYSLSNDITQSYIAMVVRQSGGMTGEEADRRVEDDHDDFLQRVKTSGKERTRREPNLNR